MFRQLNVINYVFKSYIFLAMIILIFMWCKQKLSTMTSHSGVICEKFTSENVKL